MAAPWPASLRSASSMAPAVPAITQRSGALTAAMAQGAGSAACKSASGRLTASMAPGAVACSRRPRSATTLSASSSVNTPARQAATYSPMLWPSRAAGRTPCSSHHCARAYSTTNSAGWVIAVCARRAAACSSATSGNSRVRRSSPSAGRRRRQQSSTALRKTGSRAYRSRPILTCCAP